MQSSKKKNNSFLIQGTILAIAGLLVRVIGLIYRVPLNNILGEEGVGYYSNAYDIYSLLLLLSSLSLPLAVSKIISAGYVIPFETGVIVITDWNSFNRVPKSRYRPTQFLDEKILLKSNFSGRYMLKS